MPVVAPDAQGIHQPGPRFGGMRRRRRGPVAAHAVPRLFSLGGLKEKKGRARGRLCRRGWVVCRVCVCVACVCEECVCVGVSKWVCKRGPESEVVKSRASIRVLRDRYNVGTGQSSEMGLGERGREKRAGITGQQKDMTPSDGWACQDRKSARVRLWSRTRAQDRHRDRYRHKQSTWEGSG